MAPWPHEPIAYFIFVILCTFGGFFFFPICFIIQFDISSIYVNLYLLKFLEIEGYLNKVMEIESGFEFFKNSWHMIVGTKYLNWGQWHICGILLTLVLMYFWTEVSRMQILKMLEDEWWHLTFQCHFLDLHVDHISEVKRKRFYKGLKAYNINDDI